MQNKSWDRLEARLEEMSRGEFARTLLIQSPTRFRDLVVRTDEERFIFEVQIERFPRYWHLHKAQSFFEQAGFEPHRASVGFGMWCRTHRKEEIAETLALVQKYFSEIHGLAGDVPLKLTGINL